MSEAAKITRPIANLAPYSADLKPEVKFACEYTKSGHAFLWTSNFGFNGVLDLAGRRLNASVTSPCCKGRLFQKKLSCPVPYCLECGHEYPFPLQIDPEWVEFYSVQTVYHPVEKLEDNEFKNWVQVWLEVLTDTLSAVILADEFIRRLIEIKPDYVAMLECFADLEITMKHHSLWQQNSLDEKQIAVIENSKETLALALKKHSGKLI